MTTTIKTPVPSDPSENIRYQLSVALEAAKRLRAAKPDDPTTQDDTEEIIGAVTTSAELALALVAFL